jgi:hypothetical protein
MPPKDARHYIARYGIDNPSPDDFKVCYAYGCQRSFEVRLTDEQWRQIRAVFEPASDTPELERERLSRAIGLLETIVGEMTGLDADIGGSFPGAFRSNQMDCADEAINTSTYLTMLEEDGLIQFHDAKEPVVRGFFFNGWPHLGTVLVEKETGTRYVIDSSFLDNGEPAFVLPYKKWKSGWRPKSGS